MDSDHAAMSTDHLASALRAASAEPSREELWDVVETAARALQRPDDVAAVYREVLVGKPAPSTVDAVGRRAVAFHDEWSGESDGLVSLLGLVLAADPTAHWAFERLSMLLTVGERWDTLLALYDSALTETADPARRATLLDEAANVAKDFTGQSDRAIGYLRELFALDPSNGQVARSLERLYERGNRHRDLIGLWTARLATMAPDAARNARARIAGTWLDPLRDPAEALAATEALAAAGGSSVEVCGLLERVAVDAAAPPAVVRRAVESLRDRYDTAKRPVDAVRVLGLALRVAEDDAARAAVHRELATRLLAEGREPDAVEHLAALVVLEPADESHRDRLEALAERTGRHDRLADALAAAADAASDPALANALRVRAADVRCDVLRDGPGAVVLYARVLSLPGHCPAPVLLTVARRMEGLLDSQGRTGEQLDVVERLAALEPEADARRAALGRAARLAERTGDTDRALRQWSARISDEPADREALDARVELLAGAERWEALVAALTDRAAAEVDTVARRTDLVRVATTLARSLGDTGRAIAAWTSVRDAFGEDAETVDALADLYASAARWDELLALLGRAAGEASGGRRADLLARAGDAHREHLGDSAAAVDVYRAALVADPGHSRARAGATALLDDTACRPAAVDALARAYAATDAWESTLGLVEHRLDVAPDAAARAAVLMEAADLREGRAEDAAGALAYVARALPLAAGDAEGEVVEAELSRLAEATGNWAAAVAAYHAAIARAGADLAAALAYRQGEILEAHGTDGASALDAFGRAAAHDPSDLAAALAVVRVAGAIGRWDAAASALVAAAQAHGAVHTALVETLAAAAARTERGWDGAAKALEVAVASAGEALPAAVAREFETLAAVWHRDYRVDAGAAEAALLRAVARDPGDAPTLRMLAALQRKAPGRPLVDTLLSLAAAEPADLDALHEAAEVALGALDDRAAARAILSRLLERAAGQWSRAAAPDEDPRHREYVSWALRELVRQYAGEGDHAEAVKLLVWGAKLPFDAETSRAMRHEAAERAAGPLGDPERAVQLYTGILDEAPGDLRAIDRLAALYEDGGRLDALVDLRRRELALAQDARRRLALRLELARVLEALGDPRGREAALRENLAEAPGHEASVTALAGLLESAGRPRELVDLLSDQAAKLESAGALSAAVPLWTRAASLAETALDDPARAIGCHERVVALAGSAVSLDALARLHTARGEHSAAVGYLDRRLTAASADERAAVVVGLARAHLATGHADRARAVLEDVLAGDPGAGEARALLAELYRASEAWEPLADLLETAGDRTEGAVKFAALREAAEVLHRRLGAPARAVVVLERAVGIAPEDRGVRLALADARRAAGMLDGAKSLLDALVEGYGRQRPPERATAHFQLAQIAHARGEDVEALAQLETASAMDMGHAGIFRMLGDLSRDAGQLERAERAYRALLLIVRRIAAAPPKDGAAEVTGPSEVLFELHGIAGRLGQPERAKEILESAFETAARSEAESRRLERVLRTAGQPELLLRALEGRAALEGDGARAAATLADIADVLTDALDRPEEALAARLRALGHAPGDLTQHDAARSLAKQVGQVGRYAEALASLAAQARESGDGALAAALLLRLGAVAEEDLGDLARAAVTYGEAEATGESLPAGWKALDRVYGALGDTAGQARVLRKLVDGGDDEGAGAQADVLYRLAAIQLGSAEASVRDEGIDWLSAALDRDPQYPRAAEILQRAAGVAPDHEAVLALYERVAREGGEAPVLLDALTRRAALRDVATDTLREAVELAGTLGETDRAEGLLKRAVEVARDSATGLSEAVWALEALAERRQAAGDVTGAVAWLREAAGVAEPSEAFQLGLQVAHLAAGALGDLRLAAETYEALRSRDATERAVWEPLLEVYRLLGDDAALERLIEETVGSVFEQGERSRLRMERARILLRHPDRADDAAATLRDVLDEDPDDVTATGLLADLFERAGRADDLADLLARQFDAARDRRDPGTAVLALRLAGLMVSHRRDQALDTLRAALEVVPEDRDLLRAFVGILGPADDAEERAVAAERLLALESGADAAVLAEHLAALRESQGDDVGLERALERGFRAQPTHTALRERLEARYTTRGDWKALAALRELEATHRADPVARAAGLRDAATMHRDHLGDPAMAAEILKRARAEVPGDPDLLAEHARSQAAAGRRAEAVAEVSTALETAEGGARVGLLRLRAELRGDADDEKGAAEDLETAYGMDPDAAARDLASVLDRRRAAAARAGDRGAEREATLRLADILPRAGRADMGFALLAEWIESEPTDREALRRLADLNVTAERWDAAATAFHKLVIAEEGAGRTEAAMKLAEACEKAGRLPDAREGLERAYASAPESDALRGRLRQLYQDAEAFRELAALWTDDADHAADDAAKFDRLRKAGEIWLDLAGDAVRAIAVLERALAVKPGDHDVTVLLADAYTAAERFEDASKMLNEAIAAHKGRRSRELAVLQHRMGRLAYAAGDHQVEMAWLNVALDTDMQNGQVAAELADVAMELQQFEIALKALRAVTLMKTPAPMSRAVAFLRQGVIAQTQGDAKKAAFFARKALAEDPALGDAQRFLESLAAD